MIAEKHGLSKDDLDAFALESHKRAIKATNEGLFEQEMLPLERRFAGVEPDGTLCTTDEGIRFDASLEGIAGVKLIQELKDDLSDYLDRKGFSSIEAFRGIARDRIVEHAQVRRKSDDYNGGYKISA